MEYTIEILIAKEITEGFHRLIEKPFPLRTVIPVLFSSSSKLALQLPLSVASVPC
ncbi:hypothetical protein [Intestinimonas butyriciproducens]|uniref:hypothetical protein n=1 Tax=Intestinimonas butyriciproducens TaxID=1297617 RepID=UPI0018AB34C4|nr:hypothetical protein [Intestinimonas butyriciproducens]